MGSPVNPILVLFWGKLMGGVATIAYKRLASMLAAQVDLRYSYSNAVLLHRLFNTQVSWDLFALRRSHRGS